MPIVSHKIEGSTDNSTSRAIVVRYYDQIGTEYTQSFWLEAGIDLDVLISAKTADMNEQLAQQEFETIVGAE